MSGQVPIGSEPLDSHTPSGAPCMRGVLFCTHENSGAEGAAVSHLKKVVLLLFRHLRHIHIQHAPPMSIGVDEAECIHPTL